jgi:hypothetical protein
MPNDVLNDNRKKLSRGASGETPSVYELLRGKLTFSDEPQWVRVLLYLITAVFFIVLFWILKESALFAFITRKLSEKWQTMFKLLKRGSS